MRILCLIPLLAAAIHAEITTVFPVPARGPSGRTYTITSTQMGNAFDWGKRGIYSFAPIHVPDGSYALVYTSCAQPGSACNVSTEGLYVATSPNGTTNWTLPTSPVLGLPPGATDMAAARAVNFNGTWYVYVQALISWGDVIWYASGPSLTSLTWASSPIVQSPSSGTGIGESHQWFNTAAYGGLQDYTVFGVFNDWNYALGGDEFAALLVNGTQLLSGSCTNDPSLNCWYGPLAPALYNGSSIVYPDVILSGSTDAASYGDISFTLGDGCFSQQEAYRPVVGLGFYNAPYPYANGTYYNYSPITIYNSNPGYSSVVIETSGVNNSGFRPRFARNQYGYIDPVPGSNPRQWTTYVYYTSNQVGQNSDTGCNYTTWTTVDSIVGVTLVTITEQ